MTKEIKTTAPDTTPERPGKKKKIASLDRKKARAGWLFVLPFLIGLVMIYIPLIFNSIKLSFCTTQMTDTGAVYVFSGWSNYYQALFVEKVSGTTFLQALFTGLQELVLQIPAIIIFALFMAVLLNQKMAGRAVFRAIFFVPVIIATGIMESLTVSDPVAEAAAAGIDTGAEKGTGLADVMDFEKLFSNMPELAAYVTDLVDNIFAIVNRAGVQMLIFLAGLQSISPAIYESCKIDGATGWETFWKITFPMISPMILVNSVYTIIDSFTSSTNSVMTYIDSVTTDEVASAMAWVYFLIVMLIVGVIAAVISANVFYQRREH